MSRGRRGARREAADLEIAARASVRELRFEKVPETGTRFRGDASRRSHSESQRLNLPDEVRSGAEYRDASIEWRASGWIDAEKAAGTSLPGESSQGGVEGPDSGHPGD